MWSVASEPVAPSAKAGAQGDKTSTERQRPPPWPNQLSTGCPAATSWPPRSCCASLNRCLPCLIIKLPAQPTKGYLQGSNKDNLLTSILAHPCALIRLMHTHVHICMHTSTHTQTKHLCYLQLFLLHRQLAGGRPWQMVFSLRFWPTTHPDVAATKSLCQARSPAAGSHHPLLLLDQVSGSLLLSPKRGLAEGLFSHTDICPPAERASIPPLL